MVSEDSIWCCIWPSYCAPSPVETQYFNDYTKLALLIVVGCSVFCFIRKSSAKADRTAQENTSYGVEAIAAADSMGKLKTVLKKVASQTNRVCAESGAETVGGKAMGSLWAVRNAIVEFVRDTDYEPTTLQRGEPTSAGTADTEGTAGTAETTPGQPLVAGNKSPPQLPPPQDLAV